MSLADIVPVVLTAKHEPSRAYSDTPQARWNRANRLRFNAYRRAWRAARRQKYGATT